MATHGLTIRQPICNTSVVRNRAPRGELLGYVGEQGLVCAMAFLVDYLHRTCEKSAAKQLAFEHW